MALTTDQIGKGVRSGWGAITRMEVSGAAKTDWAGTRVKEVLSSGTNDCEKGPACANTSAQAGNAGSTWTVGAASPAFSTTRLGEVIPAQAAKKNSFFDIHVQGGGDDWCAANGSCSRSCTQHFECGGKAFGSTFTVSWSYSTASRKDPKGDTVSICAGTLTEGRSSEAMSSVTHMVEQPRPDSLAANVKTTRPLPLQRAPLRIGPVDDPAEHEAERVAERVLTSTAPTGLLQRACACGGNPGADGECAECRAKRLQRRPASASAAFAPPIVHEVLAAPGRQLDSATRSFFAPRLGHELDSVRVHTGARAAASADAVGALAYTVGSDVVFGAGQYTPAEPSGRRLLAHELTHVAQQRAAAPVVQRYSHQDCTEDDLKNHVWPADGLASQMVKKAIRVLSATAIDPSVTPLFTKYFMTSSPSPARLLKVFDKIDAEFRAV